MGIERLRSECLSCLLKSNLEKCPADISEERKLEYMQRILKICADASKLSSAPVIVREISKVQEEMFGIHDEYAEIKYHFNEVMMGWEEQISKELLISKDPLKLAIQYAMVGNYIDYGAMKEVDEHYLTELLKSAHEKEFDQSVYEKLKCDLKSAKQLVYLTDNCGEIVMDKLLIQLIRKLYPQIQITVIVRGKEIINDATMEDARQIGLTEIVSVIGNGTDIAGTWMEDLSAEAKTAMECADLIIAKGQGNYETLRGAALNIYYLFLCKCDMFAKNFQVSRFTGMLVNDRI